MDWSGVSSQTCIEEFQARHLAKQHMSKLYHKLLGDSVQSNSSRVADLATLPEQRGKLSPHCLSSTRVETDRLAAIHVHDRLLEAEHQAATSTASRARVSGQDKHSAIGTYLREHIQNDHKGDSSAGEMELLLDIGTANTTTTLLPHEAQLELYARRIAREEQRLSSLRATRKKTALRHDDTLADNQRVRCASEIKGPVVAALQCGASGADSGDTQGIYDAARGQNSYADELDTALQREMAALQEDRARLRVKQSCTSSLASVTNNDFEHRSRELPPGRQQQTPKHSEDLTARLEQELALLQQDRRRKQPPKH
eukprot:m.1059514 g.1059514  ORF g.1059514 m.1059514 type:complete len:313 (-) comp24209_c0_seq22:3870-4808(-)